MKNNSGFTLIELMTVIATIAILSTIAVPNMINWRANHQLTGSAREVMALINGARISAIKNNAIVTITCNAGTVQATYINRVTGVARTISTVLKPGVTMPAVSFTGNNTGFRFNSRGLPIEQLPGNGFAAGSVSLSNSKGTTLRVLLASTGSTRIDKI